MKPKMTYNEAVAELESILESLENSKEIDMDLIAGKVKRAGELMEFCKMRLHELDTELEKILEQLD